MKKKTTSFFVIFLAGALTGFNFFSLADFGPPAPVRAGASTEVSPQCRSPARISENANNPQPSSRFGASFATNAWHQTGKTWQIEQTSWQY